MMEQQYLHTKRRNVDAAFFKSVDPAFFEFLTFPGVQHRWQLTRDHFAVEFSEHVDNAIVAARRRGYQRSFKSHPPRTGGTSAGYA
jgi:hypothetical protein